MMKQKFKPLTTAQVAQLEIGKIDEELIIKEEIYGTSFSMIKTKRGIKLKMR